MLHCLLPALWLQDILARQFDFRRRIFADEGSGPVRYTNGRNPYEEGTDTRFETESEMMELCELAEIL
jgi:hypothetical protein